MFHPKNRVLIFVQSEMNNIQINYLRNKFSKTLTKIEFILLNKFKHLDKDVSAKITTHVLSKVNIWQCSVLVGILLLLCLQASVKMCFIVLKILVIAILISIFLLFV